MATAVARTLGSIAVHQLAQEHFDILRNRPRTTAPWPGPPGGAFSPHVANVHPSRLAGLVPLTQEPWFAILRI